MEKIKCLNYDELIDFVDKKFSSEKEFRIELKNKFNFDDISKRSVLGIDIYQYSNYPTIEQTLIPFLFKRLYLETINFCLNSNVFIFQDYYVEEIEELFISTGDGGFQIFKTPLHSILFAIGFASNVRAYNSFEFFSNLRGLIGEINLRYSLTYDDIFNFDNNHYGPAIINNARILSKDTLNRCLLDENTYQWFLKRIRGLETIQSLNLEDIHKIDEFKKYDISLASKEGMNVVFSKDKSSITSADLLKIGTIQAKRSYFSIYNLHIQVFLKYGNEDETIKYVISLGNLNTSGIT